MPISTCWQWFTPVTQRKGTKPLPRKFQKLLGIGEKSAPQSHPTEEHKQRAQDGKTELSSTGSRLSFQPLLIIIVKWKHLNLFTSSGVREVVGAREGQREDSDTINEKEVAKGTMAGTQCLPQTWRSVRCRMGPELQNRESTQSCAMTPKDARREKEHRTASETAKEGRGRGCGWPQVLTHPPQADGLQRSGQSSGLAQ